MRVTRRGLVIGALAGGGLALGYILRPRRFPLPLSPGRGEVAFDAWIKLAADGMVTVAVPQLEMGQGITTLIPQIVAMELGADWANMAVEPAPPSALYANFPLAARWAQLWSDFPSMTATPLSPLTRRWAEDSHFNVTADGTSLEAYEAAARHAAASVRAMLAMAAAKRWNADWQQCEARGGMIVYGTQRMPFGKLAIEAAAFDPPEPPPLRAAPPRERPSEFAAEGTPLNFPRLDLPSKANGSHLFAGDVRLPGMVYAAIRHGPIGDSTLATFDKAKAQGISGLISLVKGKRWLAAVASDWWAAERALAAIAPTFNASHRADSAMIEEKLGKALLNGETHRIHESGEPDNVNQRPFALTLLYNVAPALHATLETASVTARISGGKLELWAACQAPEAARRAAARAAGMSERNTVLYPMPAGGSFDRRLEHDHVIEAAVIARETGKPVQLIWSRWQEHVAGWPRTPVAAVMAAKVGEGGRITGWKARLAMPSGSLEFGERLFGGKTPLAARAAGGGDALAMEGAIPPYDVPDMSIEHVPVTISLPTARMRGNSHGYTAFFTESFVDELARRAGREPLSFRIAMLGGDVRLIQCMQRAAAMANWDAGADASGQGLACHRIAGGRIAVIATARRDESGVRVDKISAVADIGRIVNLDIARQQIEGGLVYGIGLALGSSTAYVDGIPATGRLAGLGLPLLADCPDIAVDFIDSDAEPADPGELGVAAVAPALANALFSATGFRFRRLPLLSEEL